MYPPCLIFLHGFFDVFHGHFYDFVPHGSSAAVHDWSALQKGGVVGHDAAECGTCQIKEVAFHELGKGQAQVVAKQFYVGDGSWSCQGRPPASKGELDRHDIFKVTGLGVPCIPPP